MAYAKLAVAARSGPAVGIHHHGEKKSGEGFAAASN
jgi:hypothetical protein